MNPKTAKRGKEFREEMMRFISCWWHRYRCAPTIRDMQDMLYIKSTSNVQHHVKTLLREGRLEQTFRGVIPKGCQIVFADTSDWYLNTITSPCGGPDHDNDQD